jgi:hypothetical protein
VVASSINPKIPLRFKTVTQQTVSSLTVLGLLCEEPPVNWYSSRVSQNAFQLTPQQQYEKYVK